MLIDAQVLKKDFDFLDTIEFREPFVLRYQPPPIEISFEPGMGYEQISEQFRQNTFESSRDGLSSMLSQCDDMIRKGRPKPARKKKSAWDYGMRGSVPGGGLREMVSMK
ncbi:MAG: hypothetical protein RDV48_22925 [Candidatus Eremiobacteraeota bacterium]|nr:hypothetical protein [Candidatus Eremiobacteraeota bacterium]